VSGSRADRRIVVIGGGNAGLSIAGRLQRRHRGEIIVIEPRTSHVYAPLQSHIAGGAARVSEATRPQSRVTPKGVRWVQDTVTTVAPERSVVVLASGVTIGYDDLIVAAGIEQDWDSVPGLAAAMADERGVSNYTLELAAKASRALRDLTSGTVVFTQPPEPASAAGVAQKPMYLAAQWWWSKGVARDIRMVFVSPEPTAFANSAVSAELQRKLDGYGIETRFSSDLLEVDAERREIAIGRGIHRETIAYDLLHATPPQRAAGWIAESGLAGSDGFVDIDPRTLRHRRHPNVWALGDAASVQTLRSGGAIRKQAQTLAKNLADAAAGRPLSAAYDGYTVTPITVTRRTVVFAEFDGSDTLRPTLPFWKSLYRERRLTWMFDRYILPKVYWHLILRGLA
jgi:sulfide:quinone oxidoreductase